MPISILFWVLMILWLLFGCFTGRTRLASGDVGFIGGGLLLFILLALLGWQVFGPVLQR